jgi:hypothetical protein
LRCNHHIVRAVSVASKDIRMNALEKNVRKMEG